MQRQDETDKPEKKDPGWEPLQETNPVFCLAWDGKILRLPFSIFGSSHRG